MPETDLLLSLAEIAGVFLGFGALISIRSAGTSDAYELTYIRGVVAMGTYVIVAALAPVTLSHYGITGHEVWLLSSLVFVAVFWGTFAVEIVRVPESRAVGLATPWARRAVSGLLYVPMNVALVLVVLGLFPAQEPALYLTAVGLLLVLAASFLLSLAYSFGRPQTA
ncbi:MAG: hypothetical protein MUQ32_12965 [Chloroflexi bacterium]|nr:hypothetical protein [Chloroflexota bacterium]